MDPRLRGDDSRPSHSLPRESVTPASAGIRHSRFRRNPSHPRKRVSIRARAGTDCRSSGLLLDAEPRHPARDLVTALVVALEQMLHHSNAVTRWVSLAELRHSLDALHLDPY